MFCVNERRSSSCLLRLRNRLESQGRLATTLRSVDLDDSPAWKSTNAECGIK